MGRQAYCIHCKKKVDILEGQLHYYRNGTPVEKGKCKECGFGVTRMYVKEEREELKARSLRGEKV